MLYTIKPFHFFDKDVEELDTDLLMQVMKIAIIGDRATIVVEGTKVLQRFDVARSCALLMGVIYALNLRMTSVLRVLVCFEPEYLVLSFDGCCSSSKASECMLQCSLQMLLFSAVSTIQCCCNFNKCF